MYQVVRVMLAAFVAVALVHTSGAATAQPVGMPPAIKQIKLTEKQIEAFIAAQKE